MRRINIDNNSKKISKKASKSVEGLSKKSRRKRGLLRRLGYNYIAVLDSGAGGLAVLKKLRTEFGRVNFLCVSDSENVPYGEKSQNEILALCEKNVKIAIKNGAKALIVACNTMSVVGKSMFLKSGLPCFFIEPPLEKIRAASLSEFGCGVFCTEATARAINSKLSNIFNVEKNDCRVYPQKNLAAKIEWLVLNESKTNDKKSSKKESNKKLGKKGGAIKNKNKTDVKIEYDGDYRLSHAFICCTHYIHIEKLFNDLFKDAKLHDCLNELYIELEKFFCRLSSEERAAFFKGKLRFCGNGFKKIKAAYYSPFIGLEPKNKKITKKNQKKVRKG